MALLASGVLPMTIKQLQAEFDKLRELRIKRNKAKAAFDKAEKAWRTQMMKVRDLADDNHIKHQDTAKGGYAVPAPTWYASIQDLNAFTRWAKVNAPGALPNLSKRATKPMHELVRQAIEDGEPLPPGLGSYFKAPVKVLGIEEDDDETDE
jgi:hypothetical protein